MSQEAAPNFVPAILAFHRIITRGLSVSLENAKKGNAALEDNRAGFSDYVHCLASVVHAHHLTEDEVIFPFVKTVLPEPPYDKLSADHKLMDPMLESVENADERWKAGADDALGEISSSLGSLSDLWHPHIKIEEAQIYLPDRLAELVEPQEHVRIMTEAAELGFKSMGPLPLVVPFLMYNLQPVPRSMLVSRMPQEMAEQLVPVTWKDQWAPMKPFMLE